MSDERYVESWPKALKARGNIRTEDRPVGSRKTLVLVPDALSSKTTEGRSNLRTWFRMFAAGENKLWFRTDGDQYHGTEVWVNNRTLTPEMATFLVIARERVVDADDFAQAEEVEATERASASASLWRTKFREKFVYAVAQAVEPFLAEWTDVTRDDEDEYEEHLVLVEAIKGLPDAELRSAFDAALVANGTTYDDYAHLTRVFDIYDLKNVIDGADTFRKLVDAGLLSAYDFMDERDADLWYARRNPDQTAWGW